MAGLPRSIIKKYGVSKRAWAEYRKGKKKQSRSGGTGSRYKVKTVARRRRYYGRKTRRRTRRGSRGLFGLSTKGLVAGVMVAALAGGFFADQLQQYIPVDIPFKTQATAFAIGGPAAAAVSLAKQYLAPSLGLGGSNSGGAF